jgi:6-phosphogluconolactonase
MVTMTTNQEVKIFPTVNDLFDAAAKDFMRRAIAVVSEKGIFSVVLSGGNTPKLFFNALTSLDCHKKNVPWHKIQFFFSDERYVSLKSNESNYYTAYEYLFSKVPVNPENIYRISTELSNPDDAAKDYDQTLRHAFNINDKDLPRFDLVYLGLGDNAHTASLMPFSDIVTHYSDHTLADEDNQLVVSLWVPELNMFRITLTPRAINNSKNIIFLVTGANKKMAVSEVLEGPADPKRYPAQLIHCVHGKTIWYLDQLAAEELSTHGNKGF